MEITEALDTIINARYGREVRQAIHDGIKQAYEDGTANGNANMEVSQARGSYPSLAERLIADFNNLNSNKISKGKVEASDLMQSVLDIIDKKIAKGNVTMADLTQEVKEALTGGSVAVVGEGAVDTINIKDEAVTFSKLNKSYIPALGFYDNHVLLQNHKERVDYFINGTFTSSNGVVELIDGTFVFRTTATTNAHEFVGTNVLNAPKSKQSTYSLWVAKSDLTYLTNIYFGFKTNSGRIIRANQVASSELLKVGTTYTWNNNSVENVTMKSIYDNGTHIIIQVSVNGLGDGITTLQPVISLTPANTSAPVFRFKQFKWVEGLEILPSLDYGAKVEIDTDTEFVGIQGNIIGDSLVAASYSYEEVIEEQLGVVLENHGIAGRPLANGTDNGVGATDYGINFGTTVVPYQDYYLSLIAVGTNDFKLNVPMGELKEQGTRYFDKTTFIGAYQNLIESIYRANPQINIVLFTPLQRDKDGYSTTSTNSAGHKLIDYVNAIIEIGEMYGIPVYDAYRNSGINMMTLDTWTYDRLHLSTWGYRFVGPKFAKFIKENVTVYKQPV